MKLVLELMAHTVAVIPEAVATATIYHVDPTLASQ